ncbi:MAG: hypothetical protein D6722_28120, partial [Bacteroidetes bacterium]
MLILVLGFIIYSQQRRLRFLRRELDQNIRLAQTKMNPHFIGNTLNSIDALINQEEIDKASEYLISFSRLSNAVLRNSERLSIPLNEEMEMLTHYIKLEQLRLSDRFTYAITVDDSLPMHAILVPPMLLQPVVENAIWHGLQYKIRHLNEPGRVEIVIRRSELTPNLLLCEITDNGIGRAKSQELQAQSAASPPREHSTEII